MNRQQKYIVIPLHIWTHPDLNIEEKVVLADIDSYVNGGEGVAIGAKAISSSCGMALNEVKKTLESLQLKGAIELKIDSDGAKRIIPYLYKERYFKKDGVVIVGDTPTDIDPINYDLILETWNEYCGHIQKMERMTPQRKRKTRTALKGAARTYEDLIKAIKTIPHSAFLSGRKSDGWAATYDWLIKSPENITKVLEAKYHRDFNESTAFNAVMRGEEANQKSEENDFYK